MFGLTNERNSRGDDVQPIEHVEIVTDQLDRSERFYTEDGADPSATAKHDIRLIKLLIRAHRFHTALIGSDGVPFAGA